MKVECVRERPSGYSNERLVTLPLVKVLPYYSAAPGRYVHRVRSGGIHIFDGAYSHTHLRFWCGTHGFLPMAKERRAFRRLSKLMAECPADELLCATCEGRAIGSGLLGSAQINGRMVRFAPMAPRAKKDPATDRGGG